MKSVFTKEAKIGLVTIVSLALLYLGINYLKGINLFQPVNQSHLKTIHKYRAGNRHPLYVAE